MKYIVIAIILVLIGFIGYNYKTQAESNNKVSTEFKKPEKKGQTKTEYIKAKFKKLFNKKK